MNETLLSRRHTTKTYDKQERKPSEPAHTHGRFGHSAPMKQNSIERPPTPNSGRGTESKPETTMQLRSEHCHLLKDYNHRVVDKPSDICPDCETSEDLKQNHVESIREFSYVDDRNFE